MTTQGVSLQLNGQTITAPGAPKMTLLHFLREELRLTGTKCGCSQGDCGACTVLVNGEPTKSCLVKVGQLEGKRVETVEGLSQKGRLHLLQQAFLDYGAVQCGFCTPGMLMSVKALLDRNPHPSTQDVKEALQGNLCRCTGYISIIEAVLAAASRLRGEDVREKPPDAGCGPGLLGISLPDKDGWARVTGQFHFADDLFMEGMLYGKLLLAPAPHAQILSLDTSLAEAMPGVAAVLTARDVPGVNIFGQLKPERPVLAGERVRFLGEALAVVYAESLEIAAAAVRKIRVKFRKLPVVSSPDEALAPGAPVLYDSGTNLIKHTVYSKGDADQGFAQADLVLEGSYSTPWIEHAYLEPEAGLARPTDDGGVEIWYCTHLPFSSREQAARCLGLPVEKVRMMANPVGGSFGSKTEPVLELFLALGAWKTGRPVKLTLSRSESLRMSLKRHPYRMEYKLGATKEGKFIALRARLVADAGAYSGISPAILEQAMIFSGGPYLWPHARVEGHLARTNNVLGGPCRGFGIPQVAFALESLLDDLARRLGMDPFELRLKNALEIGSETLGGEKLRAAVGIKETLRRAQSALREMELPLPEGPWKVGVGVAAGMKNIGTGRGGQDIAGSVFHLQQDGQVRLYVSALDMGQGTRTVLSQMAAEVTGCDYQAVNIVTGDTAVTPPGAGALGSRQTFLAGNAVVGGGKLFRQTVLDFAGRQKGVDPATLKIQGENVVHAAEGRIIISLEDLAALALVRGQPLEARYDYRAPKTYPLSSQMSEEEKRTVNWEEYRNYISYSYVAQVAIVKVNPETGQVRLVRLISAHDVGRLLNPLKVKGQLEGSAVMGMGFALSEQFVMDRGVNRTKTLRQCGVPTIDRTPEVRYLIVEDPDPEGPFGAKGISEMALVPTAPAILNAIYDAVGVRIRDLPATPEKVLKAAAGGL
ncbi:MAG: molybdopterin-dependent oxidoreductase [Desulfobacterales bacterium]|nr:molybdopterin-dependent oxidoreductase [Desulfobacterales bacterium]